MTAIHPLNNSQLQSNVNAASYTLTNVVDPSSDQDAATKSYVDTKMASVYPVGSVYISVVATNPNTLFGFGTWSAIGAGQVLVGLDSGDADFDTVEKTGGSKTHALTTAELATHTHVQNQHTHTQNSHNHAFLNGGSGVTLNSGASGPYNYAGSNCCVYTSGTTASRTATNQNTTPTNQNTGSGDAHTSVQPYFVVYMWKRTA